MRKAILTIFASALALTAGAQTEPAMRYGGALQHAPAAVVAPRQAAPAKASLAANQRLVGYYTTDEANMAFGVQNFPGTIQVGALLQPGDYSPFMGARIAGVRFAMGPNVTASGVAVYGIDDFFQFRELASVDETAVSRTTSTEVAFTPDWHTIAIPADQQPSLTGDYVGYLVAFKVTQTNSNYPIAVWADGPARDLYVYCNIPKSQGGNGERWYNFESSQGAVAVQMLVEGDNFPTDGAAPADFGNFTIGAGQTKAVPVTLNNIGTSLRSFAYTYTIDGQQAGGEQAVTLDRPLAVGGSYTAPIAFQAPAQTGTHAVELTVTKVNGAANGSAVRTAKGTMTVLAKAFSRGVVMEEYTGTGCGWCPRGLIGMKHLAEQYPDNFIGIGIHQYNGTDAMYNSNYANLNFSGAPNCYLNRDGKEIDPYGGSTGSIAQDFAAKLADLPEIGVEVAGWYNADSTQVSATARIESMASGTYEMAYAITADGLTGSSSAWKQSNYYAERTAASVGATADPDLAQFCRGGALGQDPFPWTFNDVLVGSSYQRTANQAGNVTLTEGGTATHEYTMNLIGCSKVDVVRAALHFDQVYVIAMVIDRSTGQIVNAAKSRVRAFDPTGVSAAPAAATAPAPAAIYNAAGQRFATLQPGLNIVRGKDGRTVKVLK